MTQRRLYKIEEGKKLCGVCAGLAKYFDVDPTIVRILWVLVTLAYGFGIIAYIIAAIIMTKESEVR